MFVVAVESKLAPVTAKGAAPDGRVIILGWQARDSLAGRFPIW